MEKTEALQLKKCNQYFGNTELFEEPVDLKIEPASVTLLYGKSGTGKSAIFDMLSYLVPPKTGEVFWDGRKIERVEEANLHRARSIGLIFSNFSFISMLSVEDNLLLPASLCGVENIDERLEVLYEEIFRFDEEERDIDLRFLLSKKNIDALSNGQKEIVMIASILLLDTKYLIADEMLRSFPDDTKEKIFRRILKYLKKRETGMLFITHWKDAANLLQQANIKQKCYKISKKRLIPCDQKWDV